MPPPAESNAARAVAGTRGLVLVYQGQPFAPLYTRSCSGRTRTPPQSGNTAAKYPYFSVECSRCRLHPAHWTSRISARDAASVRPGDEILRLAIDRKLGWSAVPSNDFSVQKEGDSFLLKGVGNGHGIGLCQTGAKDMAEQGANYRQILDHYYPNTNVVIYSR
jgi:stage II sporulation protein D